jgi:hypothetical protein
MSIDIQQLSDEEAVHSLYLIAENWMTNRGKEVYITYYGARERAAESYATLPNWARDTPEVTTDSGNFARQMLIVLIDAADDEVRVWTNEAINKVQETKAHVDPVTLSIGGAILIGAILAARVKKIGPVEFFKGIPKQLANVMKAGASIIAG